MIRSGSDDSLLRDPLLVSVCFAIATLPLEISGLWFPTSLINLSRFGMVAAILIVAQGGTVTPTIGAAPAITAPETTLRPTPPSLYAAALGGFFLGGLTVLLQVVLPDGLAPYRDAFVYGGVILVLLVRPQGLIVARNLFVRA